MTTIKTKADHHDADIVLKLYELRRESVMRQSRDAMFRDFWPRSYEDFVKVTKPDSPLNAAFRQISSYWEMAYGMAKHGIVNPDFLIENAGEGLFLFAKVAPYLERFRKEMSPTAFTNAEWIITNSEVGKQRFQMIRARVEQMAPK